MKLERWEGADHEGAQNDERLAKDFGFYCDHHGKPLKDLNHYNNFTGFVFQKDHFDKSMKNGWIIRVGARV